MIIIIKNKEFIFTGTQKCYVIKKEWKNFNQISLKNMRKLILPQADGWAVELNNNKWQFIIMQFLWHSQMFAHKKYKQH